MTVREFFENGGVVRCESEQEDAAVIEHCRDAGLKILNTHDSREKYWGLTMYAVRIFGYMAGGVAWRNVTPYASVVHISGLRGSVPPLDDLI